MLMLVFDMLREFGNGEKNKKFANTKISKNDRSEANPLLSAHKSKANAKSETHVDPGGN